MFGAIQPNVVIQGYMSMMFLYMAKHQLLDPMNGWKETGKPWGIYLPFVDNGLDVVNKDNAKYFYTKNYLKARNLKGVEETRSKRPLPMGQGRNEAVKNQGMPANLTLPPAPPVRSCEREVALVPALQFSRSRTSASASPAPRPSRG